MAFPLLPLAGAAARAVAPRLIPPARAMVARYFPGAIRLPKPANHQMLPAPVFFVPSFPGFPVQQPAPPPVGAEGAGFCGPRAVLMHRIPVTPCGYLTALSLSSYNSRVGTIRLQNLGNIRLYTWGYHQPDNFIQAGNMRFRYAENWSISVHKDDPQPFPSTLIPIRYAPIPTYQPVVASPDLPVDMITPLLPAYSPLLPNGPALTPVQPKINGKPKTNPWFPVTYQPVVEYGPSPRPVPSHPSAQPVTEIEVDGTGSPAVRPALHFNKPPPRGTREKKTSVNLGMHPLLKKAVGQFTEGLDLVAVAYKALPDEYKLRYPGSNYVWRFPPPHLQLKAVYDNIEHLDMQQFVIGFIGNQIEDRFYGMIGKRAGRHARDWYDATGRNDRSAWLTSRLRW